MSELDMLRSLTIITGEMEKSFSRRDSEVDVNLHDYGIPSISGEMRDWQKTWQDIAMSYEEEYRDVARLYEWAEVSYRPSVGVVKG